MRVEDRNRAEGGQWQPARPAEEAPRAGRTEGAEGRVAGPGEAAGVDHLKLSGVSARIRQTFERLAGAHAAHVESVAARVRAGEYRVDAQALSRAMLAADLGPAE